MSGADTLVYFSGAFGGVCVLVIVLSLLIGRAYDERMLWLHAATLTIALSAHYWAISRPQVADTLWAVQLALASYTLVYAVGSTGAMRQPARALLAVSISLIGVAVLQLAGANVLSWMLLPWMLVMGWYLMRAWRQSTPWIYWMAAGQVALFAQWLSLSSETSGNWRIASLAGMAVFAIATYLAMVWKSRLSSENTLRIEARERTDPLTGLATPRLFSDRVDGALIRSRNFGYASALILVRIDNIKKVVAENNLENSEAVILGASRAIASTLRSQDSAARLGNNRFGVLVEGIPRGGTDHLATRILAHGLRGEEWGLYGSPLQFHIAVVEIGNADIKAASILRDLEEALIHMRNHRGTQHIFTLPPITTGTVTHAFP